MSKLTKPQPIPIHNYRQTFTPPAFIYRAPRHAILLFRLQKALGWIALRRLLHHRHPWDF